MPTTMTPRVRSKLPWVAVGLAAALVRFYRLDHFSFWLDEILEAFTIRFPWPRMWTALREDAYAAPLDYALLKVAESLGLADATLRSLPALWGSACVLVCGWLIARRSTPAIGLTAATLLAFAPYHVHYSQELRPYVLGMLLISFSLLCLDRYLERPDLRRIALLYVSCLATAYTMYLAALVLIIAGSALLVEDALSSDATARQHARGFLRASPFFLSAVALGYWPWWSVLFRLMRSPSFLTAPEYRWARVGRLLSFFGFATSDWHPLGASGLLFSSLVAVGAAMVVRHNRLSFLAVWALGGLVAIELLEHRHPVYDSVFHYLPAGMALTALLAVPVARLIQSPRGRLVGAAVLILVLWLDGRALGDYFSSGRPDWRPLAGFLRLRPASETIFTSSQYAQLCVAYYVDGPDWLCCRTAEQRDIISVDSRVSRLLEVWKGERPVWLVLPGHHEAQELRDWSAHFEAIAFPTAEGDGGAVVKHLVPAQSP